MTPPLIEICESPIERSLYVALAERLSRNHLIFGADEFWELLGCPCDDSWLEPLNPPDVRGTVLAPQLVVGPYRIDIAAGEQGSPIGPPIRVAIECDGHDFHDRTKEQAQRDRERDRYLARMGFIVQRFTGSEIYADPMACADEINSLFAKVWTLSAMRLWNAKRRPRA